MKVSLNTIKRYVDFELPPVDELVARINAQLGKVEEIIDLRTKYKDPVIVKVVSAEQHPNADRLRVCLVDDGGVVADVPRDEQGYVQVVCGAPNAREGIMAVWLPPQSTVPASFDTDEPFVLDARELRGVVSQGMLAAGDELAINSDHNGIIEIDADEWRPTDSELKPGQSFAKVYGLDDTILDIENKMFTHRPDCFGQIGVAREIAGILGRKFTSPAWYGDAVSFGSGDGLALEVFNDASEKTPRFMAVALKDVTVKPSPLWLQCELVRLGSKAINNIVDATNYVMLLTAQPTHAYDYDKIRGHKLGARMATTGEKALLLNGKTYELNEDDIVIADGEGVIGLAGIMGGGNSEVSADTRNIVLEVATFDMYAVRKSSMRHGIFTDALTRFNKGQSPLQNDHILNLLMMSINDVAGGQQASVVFDQKSFGDNHDAAHGGKWDEQVIGVDFINERLGTKLGAEDMTELLTNVEFHTRDAGGQAVVHVSAPFWRTDIEQPEDVVEEIGRLYGFDKLPRELPQRSAMPAKENENRQLKQLIRESLARAGANEVLTYSFVHENIIKKAGQDPAEAYRLGNALSPDLQYYRLSLTPSLLDKIHSNGKAGYDHFALFEIGKTHNKTAALNSEGLPAESERVALVYAAKSVTAGSPYYQAKRLLDYLTQSLGLDCEFRPLVAAHDAHAVSFEPKRSAEVVDRVTGVKLGVVGEYKTSVARAFKLNVAAGFELDTAALLSASGHSVIAYAPLSRYPGADRDVCYQVAPEVSYAAILDASHAAADAIDLSVTVVPTDIYQPQDGSYKNVTLRYSLVSYDHTLTGDEVTHAVDALSQRVVAATAAQII